MGHEGDCYLDEDGEPLMDYDDLQEKGPSSPEPLCELEDDLEEDPKDCGVNEGSFTLVYDKTNVKPRRRFLVPDLANKDDLLAELVAPEGGYCNKVGKKRKNEKDMKQRKKKKMQKREKGSPIHGVKNSAEIEEMWDSILRKPEDDNFIDDSGLDPSKRFGSETEEDKPSHRPQAEEDEEINRLFKTGKRKKKSEKRPEEIAMLVENVMAELEIAAEDDAELNREGKPAVKKLKKLPFLTETLSKKQLRLEFLDHGVLNVLKSWLEPLPDGSLPNINIRAAVLQILTDLQIDLDQYDRREQLKNSGLGKVVMFLSKSDEETTANKRLAKDLVDRWSRPIFKKSTRFEDMRDHDNGQMPFRRTSKKLACKPSEMQSGVVDVDFDLSRMRKPGSVSSKGHARRPEATPMDFVIRPKSKVDAEAAMARAKLLLEQNQIRTNINKKLQRLKTQRREGLQAMKPSAEGRSMLNYL